MNNPYRRLRGRPWTPRRAGLALASVGLAALLARGSLLGFLDRGAEDLGPGLDAVVLRLALLMLVVLGLRAHTRLLRSPDRPALALLPVDAAAVVRVAQGGLRRDALWLSLAAGGVLLPVALTAGWLPWALAVVTLVAVGWAAAESSAVVLLGAIVVAEHPAWQGILDAARGRNPRAQAALIWALAPSALGVGFLATLATGGLAAAVSGDLRGMAWSLPLVALALLLRPVPPRLGRRAWHRATVVLGEISARYAAMDPKGHDGWVPGAPQTAWLPAPWRPHALAMLRRGARGARSWISAAWAVSLLGCARALVDAPGRTGELAALAAGLCFLAGMTALRVREAEPPFLRLWLAGPAGPRLGGQAFAVGVWAVAPLSLLLGLVWLRGGGVGPVAVSGLVALLVAAAAAPSLRRVPYVLVAGLLTGMVWTLIRSGSVG